MKKWCHIWFTMTKTEDIHYLQIQRLYLLTWWLLLIIKLGTILALTTRFKYHTFLYKRMIKECNHIYLKLYWYEVHLIKLQQIVTVVNVGKKLDWIEFVLLVDMTISLISLSWHLFSLYYECLVWMKMFESLFCKCNF